MHFRIACHGNKMLFWHAATTRAAFSLMTDLRFVIQIENIEDLYSALCDYLKSCLKHLVFQDEMCLFV